MLLLNTEFGAREIAIGVGLIVIIAISMDNMAGEKNDDHLLVLCHWI